MSGFRPGLKASGLEPATKPARCPLKVRVANGRVWLSMAKLFITPIEEVASPSTARVQLQV